LELRPRCADNLPLPPICPTPTEPTSMIRISRHAALVCATVLLAGLICCGLDAVAQDKDKEKDKKVVDKKTDAKDKKDTVKDKKDDGKDKKDAVKDKKDD